MLNKFYRFIYKCSNKKKLNLKKQDGMALVEVVVAFLILSIITLVLVRGTIVSVDTLKINRAKTKAQAIASEKLEIIRAMAYEDIDFTSENPNWGLDNPVLVEDEYDISYEIIPVYEGDSDYKQLKITIFKDPMKEPINVITQMYPLGSQGEGPVGHPVPVNLVIDYDSGSGSERDIKLIWEAPDTELEIDEYKIYRDGNFIGTAASSGLLFFIDEPGDNEVYSYYVTALYDDETESSSSNTVTTEIVLEYLPPRNLDITGYSGEGSGRAVNLEWDAPDTELTVTEYAVYRDGVEIGRTADTNYQNTIGTSNYTFYVTAIYEGGIEGDQSNTVTTESEAVYPPPRNLSITWYYGWGYTRTVYMAWDAPDTELVVTEYAVYRNGIEIGRTVNRYYSNRIGYWNYTFYVTAIYEGGIESDPSNEVTTH